MSYPEHQQLAAGIVARAAVITLSDTRTEQTDKSGARMKELLLAAGHAIAHYQIVRDEPAELEPILANLLARNDVDLVLTNGGTGISRRDQTISVVMKHLDPPLDGFGELFRMLSWQQIGSGAMLSRAAGGIAQGKVVFCLPGSTKAVELGMEKLILPELGHLLRELRK